MKRNQRRDDRGGALVLVVALGATAGLMAAVPSTVAPVRVEVAKFELTLALDAEMAPIPATSQALRAQVREDDPHLVLSGTSVAVPGPGILGGPAGTFADGSEVAASIVVAGHCVWQAINSAGQTTSGSWPAAQKACTA